MNFNEWIGTVGNGLSGLFAAQEDLIATHTWQRILDKPASLILQRNGVAQAAQTVRIDVDSRATEVSSASGIGSIRNLTVLGVRGHPTIADTDIRKGDIFYINKVEYTVKSINTQIVGEVQAYASALS